MLHDTLGAQERTPEGDWVRGYYSRAGEGTKVAYMPFMRCLVS